MIRYAVICLSTLLVVVGVFFTFIWHSQPNAVKTKTSIVDPTASAVIPSESHQGIGPGSRPRMNSYDEQGKLVSSFTANNFKPRNDGKFEVDHPISEFYLDKGQKMVVTGDSGVVVCDSAGPGSSKGGLFATPTTTPRNGLLKHVHIDLFPTLNAVKPTQWMDADNIHFDNDHLRMWTETYPDEQGNIVEADQVPVTIRGEQYEFDGKGMTLIWNGVSRRLEELQIMHGHRLQIKDLSKLSLPGMTPAEPAKTEPTGTVGAAGGWANDQRSTFSVQRSSEGPFTFLNQLVSTNRSDVKLIMATNAPAPPPQPATPYRAVFHDHVKIDDADRRMAAGDIMTVDFLQGSHGPQAATAPAANMPAAASVPLNVPAKSDAAAPPPPIADKAPATKPTNGPLTIYWTGPLIVTPLRGDAMLPLAAGQSIINLVGSPAKLTPEGSEITAASVTYRSPDGAAVVENSPAVPRIHLAQNKGLDLLTERIDYNAAISIATLSGPSELQVPAGEKTMDVTFSKQAILHVVRLPGQPNGVNHVDLTDDVHVRHPQFTLDSRQLVLDLDLRKKEKGSATDAEEQLKMLTAIDSVKCRLIQAGKPGDTGIDSDKLIIQTLRGADGSTVPREVEAIGHVNAFDPNQSIHSDSLEAMLQAKPKDKLAVKSADDDVASDVELESMHAVANVHARLKSGATADTDDLAITGAEGNRQVILQGSNGSTLNNGKTSRLESMSTILLTPDAGGVQVLGPGRMSTVRTSSTTQPLPAMTPQPTEVSWRDSMQLDSKANSADLYGYVKIVNHDLDGSVDTCTGDQCHLDLVDSPKNETKPVKKKPAESSTDPMASAMGGKELKKLTLTGHVNGFTELKGPDGKTLRQGELFGDKMIYTTADGIALIPGAGKMFVENHKPDAKADAQHTGNNRGAMAVEWKKKLAYNQLKQVITIDGDAVVGFEQEAKEANKPKKPQEPMQLYSQELVITLNKTAPDNKPAIAPQSDASKPAQEKMQLSKMQAFNDVRFIGPGVDLTCDNIEYDPLLSLLIARGTPQQPGETRNPKQTVTGSFDELRYDTIKEEVLSVKGSKVQMRH